GGEVGAGRRRAALDVSVARWRAILGRRAGDGARHRVRTKRRRLHPGRARSTSGYGDTGEAEGRSASGAGRRRVGGDEGRSRYELAERPGPLLGARRPTATA